MYTWPVRSGQGGSISLPKTGQTNCYDTAGTEIVCTGTGQDGDIQAGVAWPNPRFTDNGDGTITDNLTGLMWTQNAGTPTVGACTGGSMAWQDALNYVACLNTNNYLGHSDWSLPNSNEAKSLLNEGEIDNIAWLNAQGFSNMSIGSWSSTTDASDTNSAWAVSFMHCYISNGFIKASGGNEPVLPVRGGNLTAPSDTTPPTTTASPVGGTYSSAQNVTLTCYDGSGSGCQTTYYCTGSGCNPTTVYSGSGAINIASSTVLRFYSKDNDNNNESTKTETYTINILDTTPPTTTASPSGGTYSSAQNVTLSCNDGGGSGCQTTYYCTGTGCNPTTVYLGAIINIGSSTVLRFYSKDNANNNESVKSAVYTINLPGQNQRVDLDYYIYIIFSQVSNIGTSSSSIFAGSTGPAPSGYNFIGNFYELTTSADYNGIISVTIPYNQSSVPSGKEGTLSMFHWEDGKWKNVTVSVDTGNNTITGSVNSFSPFVIGYYTSSGGGTGSGGTGGGGYSTGANEDMIALITILAISAGVFILRKNRWLRKA